MARRLRKAGIKVSRLTMVNTTIAKVVNSKGLAIRRLDIPAAEMAVSSLERCMKATEKMAATKAINGAVRSKNCNKRGP